MAKTKISEFSANPANNTDIDSINIAEGCAPSGINDAIRELMAQLKDFQAGTAGDSFNGPVGTSTAAAGAFTTLAASGTTTLSVTDNANAALRITQLGTGNALLVEDETNPDSTPFVVTADGRVIVGATQAYAADGDTQQLQVQGLTQASASASLTNWSATASSEPNLVLAHSCSGAIGTHTASVANDNLGNITFCGSNGSVFNAGVAILAEAEGTWSGSSTPAKVTFFTVPSGSTSGVDRMIIDSVGNVGIGTATPAQLLDLNASNTGLVSTTANNTLRFTDTDTSTATNQPLGKIEWYSADATTSARVGAYILATAQGTSGGGNLEFGTATNTGTVTEQMQITGAGDLQFNSGYGSVATAYGCRAWVNFNGTGTVAIRASGNVSSITDNGVGDYTVNFTTAMPDANYSATANGGNGSGGAAQAGAYSIAAPTASALRIQTINGIGTSTVDLAYIAVNIFR